MKKNLLLALCITLNINYIYAQWNIISVGTTQDLYSVDYYSLNDTWIGSLNQIVKTSNGGTSWSNVSLLDNSSAPIQPCGIYDLALASPIDAIATGLFSLGNTECILNTTNGVNWNYASTNTTVGLPRYLNSVDVSSTRAAAVGNNGRIAISSNSGNSWTFVSSGVNTYINDVKFASYDTVFAAGDYRILRSVNGGASWTFTTVNGGLFRSVSCDHNTIYIGDGANNAVLKSTNYGTTYSTINLPFTYQGVLYAVDRDTLVAAADDGLYVSRSGGQFWEKYILPSYNTIRMFDFYDKNKVIAVGNAGYVLKTDNLSLAPKIPVAVFSIAGGSSQYCLGDSISIINSTIPGCVYQWEINGTNFSSLYSPGISLTTVGSKTISLISTNGNGSDTMNIVINVTGHNVINPFTFSSNFDTICNNTTITFSLPTSQTGVLYQLRKNFSNVGLAKVGTGSTLTFSAGAISGTNTFSINATQSNNCFVDSLVNFITIYSAVFPDPLTNYISALDDSICPGESFKILITNTYPGITYSLKRFRLYDNYLIQTNNFTLHGNDSLFVFPQVYYSGYFYYTAITSNGCTINPSDTATVIIDRAISSFNMPVPAFVVNDTISIINSSLAEHVYWNFPSSILAIDTSSFSSALIKPLTSGTYPITLIAESLTGCRDTSSNFITIIVPATQTAIESCMEINTNLAHEDDSKIYETSPSTIHIDHNGNYYIGGFDITIGSSSYYTSAKMHISKYDSLGNIVWTNYSNGVGPGDHQKLGICEDITVDNDGNVFVTGSFTGDNVSFGNIGNTCNYTGHKEPRGFVVKFDSDGNCLWRIITKANINGANPRPSHITDIEFSPDGKIFFLSYNQASIIFADGQLINTYSDNAIIQIDASGNFIKAFPLPSNNSLSPGYACSGSLEHFSYDDNFTLNANGRFKVYNDKIIYYSIEPIKLNQSIKVFNATYHTLSSIHQPSICGFIYIIDTAGTFLNFFKTFEYYHNLINSQEYTYEHDILPTGLKKSLDNAQLSIDKLGSIYTTFSPTQVRIENTINSFHFNKYDLPGANSIDSLGKMSLIQKWDLSGNELYHNFTGYMDIKGITTNADNNLYGIANYLKFASFSSSNGQTYGIKSTSDSSDVVLFSYDNIGNFNWLKTIGSTGGDNADDIRIKDTCNFDIYFSVSGFDTLKSNNYSAPTTQKYQIFRFNPQGACTNTFCYYDTTTTANSIIENTNISIKIYPNPASDYIYIQFEGGNDSPVLTYVIYNTVGQKISEGRLIDNKINIENIATGFYYLNIKTEKGAVVQKLIINNEQ